ncbi:NAD-dependent epimerase/dehydratase family protein [Pedobacter kyonggii]|uniref:NAD-dependent epimerase/dehydratase family protein n=1 Tax=Pedobacter kyonggii TaxID=1926871 RepID=A0A4Q9HG45_9SPHI|nr:NAD-dependent epimerase/dehydratase family protein [Pedobacter kyonggii]TBO43312.1 NAD-dependent epimerase/dehydratase family protein [Pedobacter kyonggii]
MNRILITGASGFVGKNLVPYLNKFSNITTALGRNQMEDKSNFAEQDAIIHLAGKAHDLKKSANSEEYYSVNFELTKKLYDVFLKSEMKKFIYISSVKAVADSLNETLTEERVPAPATHYGKSKLMAEEYIMSIPLPEGKSYFILRPCMIHGPGNKGNLNLLYQFVQKGIPYPLSAYENKRSFLSIENLCYVIKELLKRNDIPSDVYNVADREPVSTNEVVCILAASLNKTPKLWNIPKSLLHVMAAIGDRLKLPLNTERLNKLTENYVVSNRKITEALSSALPIESREGLIQTAKSFKSS